MDLGYAHANCDDDEGVAFLPRRGARLRLCEVTNLRATERSDQEVTVCDLSTAGFMAECMRPVLIGSFVSLDLPGIGPVHAQIRWQVGGRMGGKFLDPIAIHRCAWVAALE